MVRIILCGCNGKMGKTITGIVNEDEDACIVAGVDKAGTPAGDYPVFGNLKDVDKDADVIIDFSRPETLEESDLLGIAEKRKMGLVLCSTGYSDDQIQKINAATERVAILRSANMSLGVNLLLKLVEDAAAVLCNAGFDPEIVERHHNQKVDAPSGTALAFADAINEVLNYEYDYKYDRHSLHEKRPKKEIGISSVRGGNIVGEHEIIFAGTDEVIEFKHSAYSKAVFGKGAVSAAKFLKGKHPGMYSMTDVVR